MRPRSFETLLGQLEQLALGQRDAVLQAMQVIGRNEPGQLLRLALGDRPSAYQ